MTTGIKEMGGPEETSTQAVFQSGRVKVFSYQTKEEMPDLHGGFSLFLLMIMFVLIMRHYFTPHIYWFLERI